MSTIAEKRQLEALEAISNVVQNSYAGITSAISALNIHVSNDDVVSALASVQAAVLSSKTSIEGLSLLISLMNTNLAANIQGKTPILKASVARLSEILSAAIPALTPVKLFSSNTNRIGFTIYNNSTNSLYAGPANSPAGGHLFFQLGTNAGTAADLPVIQCFGPTVWIGEIWVLRNAGIGGVVGYEFEP